MSSAKTPKNLLILTTESDMSILRVKQVAEQKGFPVQLFFYSDLFIDSLPIAKLNVPEATVLLPRQPYTANNIDQNYAPVLEILLEKYPFAKVIDRKLYQKSFIQYEDKLYHSYIFDKQKVAYAKMFSVPQLQKQFTPIIAKKRLSSRGNANFIFTEKLDFERFVHTHDVTQYLYQEYLPLKADFRVLVLGYEVVGIVKRKIKIKDGNRVTVEVESVGELPLSILSQCREIALTLGCEFCGFDIGQTDNNSLFFIEYNTSPQFEGFERETGINVAEKLLSYCFA